MYQVYSRGIPTLTWNTKVVPRVCGVLPRTKDSSRLCNEWRGNHLSSANEFATAPSRSPEVVDCTTVGDRERDTSR